MNPDDLLELAEHILQIGNGTPKQVVINRAISTAYYALFHALCWEIVDRTVHRPKSHRLWSIVTPIYRSLQHGTARTVFDTLSRDRECHEALRQVSRSFLELQANRIRADYDPAYRGTRREALDLIAQAEEAIQALRTCSLEDRLILAVKLITKQR